MSGKLATVFLLIGSVGASGQTRKAHRDYVPDEKTAERIAEAVLDARYGKEIVDAQLPLLVDGADKDYWIVEVSGPKDRLPAKGGGPAVWINKHSGCLDVMDRMK